MKTVIKHYLSGVKKMVKMNTSKFWCPRNYSNTLFDTGIRNDFTDGALIKIQTKYGVEYRWFENVLCAMDYLKKVKTHGAGEQ